MDEFKKMDPQDLEYRLFPGENCAPEARESHQKAYALWKEVWQGAFDELGQKPKILADNFSRQQEVGALFYRGECVALTFFHPVDFKEPTAREDSYFQYWSDADIQGLQRDGSRVLVCSNLTVSKKWRGPLFEQGGGLKLLILQLGILRFLQTDFPTASGAMRKDRGAHTPAFDIGGVYLSTGYGLYDWHLDMVAFYRKELIESRFPERARLASELWARHVNLCSSQTFKKQIAA